MGTEESGMSCPFCKTPMIMGYVSMQMGSAGGVVYFTKEKLSWGRGLLGTSGKEKEAILEDMPDNYSRTAYKCDNCNAVLLRGKASPTQADYAQAAEARRDNENLKDRARQMAGI